MICVNIRNTKPILNALPAITNVVLTPAATPLLLDGTELIIVALLGEANIPIPAPTKTSGSIDPSKDVVALTLVSNKKPAADTSKPTGVNIRNLYLSYNHPLIGAKVAKARETGIKYIPALSGLSFIEGP